MGETIFALATAPGRAALAVIRLSGSRAQAAAESLAGAPCPLDRRMRLRTLADPRTGDRLDEALVVGFAEGASFTGEACVELQCHGGRAVTEAVLGALGRIEGLSPAGPGAFARRALENGRLSLPEVEAIADLVDAETEAQRRQALSGLSGGLSKRAEAWRRGLLGALMRLEAAIDFADEDLGDDHAVIARDELRRLAREIAAEAARGGAARAIREGFVVALVGPPNVGKSSLLNAIARRDIAITSPLAGTTRDVLEAHCDIGGFAVTLLDTAGLHETEDALDALGVARARVRMVEADLRVFVSDPDREASHHGARPGDIDVVNKADLGAVAEAGRIVVSARTGAGLDDLIGAIGASARSAAEGAGLVFRERHVAAMSDAATALEAACVADAVEVTAEEVRRAVRAMEALLGRIDVEDVLGEIFAAFCIGK